MDKLNFEDNVASVVSTAEARNGSLDISIISDPKELTEKNCSYQRNYGRIA